LREKKQHIIVMSQARLQVMSYYNEFKKGSRWNEEGLPLYVISIVGQWSMPRDFGEFPEGSKMLMLEFEDIIRGDGKMTDNDAEAVWDFVEEAMDKDVLLVVHCEEGVSRSAAIGIAIAEQYPNSDVSWLEYGIVNVDGLKIQRDKEFGLHNGMHPNSHVLNLMRLYA
jgi:rhodanese-related sulfurtransferase